MSPLALLSHLADGRFHSGQDLAAAFGVSRAAVWKNLKQVQRFPGITVHAVRGRGYRLDRPLELLDPDVLKYSLGDRKGEIARLVVLDRVDSTNAYLMSQPILPVGKAHVCLTEHQTAGRGRRGRPWISDFGRNLTFSLAWTFDLPLARLAGLSLAVGTALADALSSLGVQRLALKWPNDLYLDGRKLAGVLIEASGEASGPSRVVIGVGVNLAMPASCSGQIDQPWSDLRDQLGDCPPRNRIAAQIIAAVLDVLPRYAEHGLISCLDKWRRYDFFRDQAVQVMLGEQVVQGRYLGVNPDGALLLDTEVGPRSFTGGEVSLRPIGPT